MELFLSDQYGNVQQASTGAARIEGGPAASPCCQDAADCLHIFGG